MAGTIIAAPSYLGATAEPPSPFDWTDCRYWAECRQTESKTKLSMTDDGAGQISMFGRVPFDLVPDCLYSAFGYTYTASTDLGTGTTVPQLRRKPPLRHPQWNMLRCYSAIVQYQHGSQDPVTIDVNPASWQGNKDFDQKMPPKAVWGVSSDDGRVEVELVFRAPPEIVYFTDAEIDSVDLGSGFIRSEWQRYLQVDEKPAIEALQNTSGQGFVWAEGPSVGQPVGAFPPVLLRSTTLVTAKWFQVPESYLLSFDGDYEAGLIGNAVQFKRCMGKVNSVPFLGQPAQTVYCFSPETERKPCPLRFSDSRTHFYRDVTFRWLIYDPTGDDLGSEHARGHQIAPHGSNNKAYLATRDGFVEGEKLYRETDLRFLFAPAAYP